MRMPEKGKSYEYGKLNVKIKRHTNINGENMIHSVTISVLLFIIIFIAAFNCESSGDDKVVFQFPEFDYKENTKNVCKNIWKIQSI